MDETAFVDGGFKMLKITTPQPHIEGHTIGYISHNVINLLRLLHTNYISGTLCNRAIHPRDADYIHTVR